MDKAANINEIWRLYRERGPLTMLHATGMEITHIGEDKITGKMPVDERTHQLYGMLHGGANVALAETLASMGSVVHIDLQNQMIVGQEINANHIRSATSGWVYGEGKPLHIGRTSQVWQVEIKNEEGKLISISRCTIAVIPKR